MRCNPFETRFAFVLNFSLALFGQARKTSRRKFMAEGKCIRRGRPGAEHKHDPACYKCTKDHSGPRTETTEAAGCLFCDANSNRGI